MKPFTSLLVLAGALAAPVGICAQPPAGSPSAPDPETLKALRQTIADQARNPDKVIRTYTNVPPRQPQVASNAAGAPQAEIPVYKPDPPRTGPVSTKAAAAAALERQFLDGKLSERQYKKALADLERANSVPGNAATKSKTPATAPPPKVSTRGQLPPGEPTTPAPPPQPTIKQQKVSEAESKLDELIRQKEARDRAAQTNSVPAPVAGGTKRQRLDFLLKQVVEGKISDEEYKKQREKILAEPE